MSPLPLALRWSLAYGLTQLIEVPIYMRALRAVPALEEDGKRRFFVAFGASALTHPFVVFLFPWLWALAMGPLEYTPGHTALTISFMARGALAFALFEGFAVGAEAFYLSAFGLRRALVWSLVANLASSGFGVVLTLTTGLP